MSEKAFKDMTSDDRLEFNQQLRHDVITKLTTNLEGAREVPTDKDTLTFVQGFLKDSDRTELTKKRLDLDETIAENDALAATLLENVINRYTRPDRIKRGEHAGPQADASLLPAYTLTEGERSEVGDDVDIDRIKALGRAHYKGETQD